MGGDDGGYLALLESSYAMWRDVLEAGLTRQEFLAEYIFDFTLYDSNMSELFSRKALEVAEAITNRTTFQYIEDDENYRWFLMMVNTDFFSGKLSWGTSIRGAFWDYWGDDKITVFAHLFWKDGGQLVGDLSFDENDWPRFIRALREFVALDSVVSTVQT